MMKFLEKHSHAHSMIGICMGEQGVISRILAVRCRKPSLLLPLQSRRRNGPGQIAARTLRETYRIEQVDAATRVYGVAGDPIAHSLSPIMLNTASVGKM